MKERKRKRSEHTHPAARFAAILQNHYRLRPPALPIPQISPPSPPLTHPSLTPISQKVNI